MEGKKDAVHERWVQRTEKAYRRMFEGKSQEELVTLTQRENMAALIAKELASFLLEEHVAADPAAQPTESTTTCCPSGGAGVPVQGKEKLPERTVSRRSSRSTVESKALRSSGWKAAPKRFCNCERPY